MLYTQIMWHGTSVACDYYFFPTCWELVKSLSQDKGNISWHGRPSQRTETEVHVSTAALITQLSSLTLHLTGLSPNLHRLYVSCHCHPSLSSPGQGTASQRPSLSSKPRVNRGHRGQSAEVEAVPSQGWPHQCCQLPVAPLWRCIETQKKRGEGPSPAGTTFWGWRRFFCFVSDSDRHHPHSSTGEGQGVSRQRRSSVTDGIGKIVSVMSTIKMDRIQLCLMWPL